MAGTLQGKDVSLWVDTTESTSYPSLESDNTVYDVAIVGGGITGIAAAYHMQQNGLRVVLLEKDRLAEWTTGGTTAKLSSQHYLIYDYLIEYHGEASASAFAKANQNGIEAVANLSSELGIECDFSRRDAYVYTLQDDKVESIRTEVEAAQRLGLPASFETTTDLSFDVKAAIKFTGQAQFHPRKFLLGLASHFVENGGVIYEQTEATDITVGEPNTVVTKRGDIKAKHVLQASGGPFWHAEIFDDAMWTKMSYALGVKLKDPASYPQGMYITTDDPMRTIRSAPYEDEQLMIFGGESHEYDEDSYDPDTHYQNLIDDVQKKYDVDRIVYRWLAGDFMPHDRMPYIGAYPDHPTVYVATGYRAWGLAWAMSAARIITDMVLDKPVEWATPFNLERLQSKTPPKSDKRF